MKVALLLMSIGLLSTSAFAKPHDRWNRMIQDKVLVSLVQSIESKYHVRCEAPKESAVQWRCLNGPECGYQLNLTCPADVIGGKLMRVYGFDNGVSNDVTRVEIDGIR